MPQPPKLPAISISPEEFKGRWANAASLARTPHEFTLDFIRMGPGWQTGQVVARISFSDLLMAELAELFTEQWDLYTKEAGVPPEEGIPPENQAMTDETPTLPAHSKQERIPPKALKRARVALRRDPPSEVLRVHRAMLRKQLRKRREQQRIPGSTLPAP